MKIQRVKKLPPHSLLAPIIQKYRIRHIAIEPDSSVHQTTLAKWSKKIHKPLSINTDYFLPTKTIRVDLVASETEIFNRLSEAKRRAVRRAQKNGIIVTESNDIHAFIKLKNHAAGFLGSITTFGIDKLWNIFPEKNKTIVFASTSQKQVGGILLLFWDRIAYYWVAGASKEGKKLFAPTLLVWEALKIAKKRHARALDFVGVWDERLAQNNLEWKGFTKFKEGFGGKEIYYPIYTPQKS